MSGLELGEEVTEERLCEMHSATVVGYIDSLRRDMPECPFRDMALWALTGAREDADFFAQINAITQLGRMTTLLLSPVADEERWPVCVATASIMNAWQVHEVFSDNLAIGLGLPSELDDASQRSRRILLQTFNDEMATALRSPSRPPKQELLEKFNRLCENISLSEQTLVTEKYQHLISRFSSTAQAAAFEIDKSMAPILVANISSCLAVLNQVKNSEMRELTRRWLLSRYLSVNALLDTTEISIDELIQHGTRTILVVPTLAYYVDVFLPKEVTREFINTTLEEALCSAATLVRLLNDIGTHLLTSNDETREIYLNGARALIAESHHSPLIDALANPDAVVLTRLTKDARFREFNICLHGIGHLPVNPPTVAQLMERIRIIGGIYSRTKSRLHDLCRKVDMETRSTSCSRIITTFVEFHEELYAHHHHAPRGEYAI